MSNKTINAICDWCPFFLLAPLYVLTFLAVLICNIFLPRALLRKWNLAFGSGLT